MSEKVLEYGFEDKSYTKEEFLALAEEHKKAGRKTAVVEIAAGLKKTAAKKAPAKEEGAKKEEEGR